MATNPVALRYAEALYAAAKDAGRTDAVLADLAGVKASLEASPATLAKVLHPRITAKEKEEVLMAGPLRGKDPLIANTFRLLLRRGREAALPGFFLAYLEVHEEKTGVLRVELESATEVAGADAENIRQKIGAATGRAVVMESRVNPDLLGGLRFTIGSRLIDGSLKSRLDRIARGLREAPIAGTD